MEKNRINFGRLQILCYVERMFTCLSDLLNPEIQGLMNMPSHGLKRDEFVVVLLEMFENHVLVAKREGRGLFTPTLEEIESALGESNDFTHKLSNTFYGLTSAAHEVLVDLRHLYSQERRTPLIVKGHKLPT